MPTLSRFFGITIRMHWNDHVRPHFHAFYSGGVATYLISPVAKESGQISRRAHRLVVEWAHLHRQELLYAWDLLSRNEPGISIPGLE